MSDLQYASQNNIYDVNLLRSTVMKSGFDSILYELSDSITWLHDIHFLRIEGIATRFDCDSSNFMSRFSIEYVIHPRQFNFFPVRYTSNRGLAYYRQLFPWYILPLQYQMVSIRFVSLLDSRFTRLLWTWNGNAMQFYDTLNTFDSNGRLLCVLCPNEFDILNYYSENACMQFNAMTDYICPRQNEISSFFDVFIAYRDRYPNRIDHITGNKLFAQIPNIYDIFVYQPAQLPIRWNAIPCEFHAKELSRFDAEKGSSTSYPIHFQALVQAGWRIFAKNHATGTTQELGFIDATAEERSLSGIFLPDGDYEVSVLTSSYFWKDAKDRSFLTFSLKPDEELSPLPTVYNLRSTINGGVTSIFWSAQTSDVSDCVFGLWYSTQTPVPTNAAPDATVWYSPDMTEYQTSLTQFEPQYVAVAPMRTGNTSEIGPVAELYLDWKNAPPNAPENVVPLNNPIANKNSSNATGNVF